MKTMISSAITFLAALLCAGQALGWASANRAGGATQHDMASSSNDVASRAPTRL